MANKYGFASVNQQINLNNNPNINFKSELNQIDEKIIYARVIDIILDETHPEFNTYGGWSGIGTVFFDNIEVSSNSTIVSNTASPLLPYTKNYPLVNELILLFLLPNKNIPENTNITQYFYLNPISIWNNPHINAFPDTNKISTTQLSERKSYQDIEEGQTRKSSNETVNYNYNSPLVGGTFEEKGNIHPLLSFAGDIITEGRWGNSVRLGSTAKITNSEYKNNWSNTGNNGNPITIIRNGQPTNSSPQGFLPIVEDINTDLSSLYLTSNQTIPLKSEFRSFPAIKNNKPETITSYKGSQIILNSSRLIFNSKLDSIILNSQKSTSISSISDIGLYSRGGEITLQSQERVNLGDPGATQSLILGDNFIGDFETLLILIQNLCNSLAIEPQLTLSQGPANSISTQIQTMLDSLEKYTSKLVKTL